MSLPETVVCVTCQTASPVTRTEYNGLRQPDPTKDGFHSYTVETVCPGCGVRTVTVHRESQKQ